jgi:hypothetical protein
MKIRTTGSGIALALIGALAAGAFAASGAAQESPPPLGTVVKGDRTIVFEPAKLNESSDIQLRTWSQWALEHAQISRELGNRPALARNAAYLKKHPELQVFLATHPDIRQGIITNPGNFVAPASSGD